jgi:hypothetical protein
MFSDWLSAARLILIAAAAVRATVVGKIVGAVLFLPIPRRLGLILQIVRACSLDDPVSYDRCIAVRTDRPVVRVWAAKHGRRPQRPPVPSVRPAHRPQPVPASPRHAVTAAGVDRPRWTLWQGRIPQI